MNDNRERSIDTFAALNLKQSEKELVTESDGYLALEISDGVDLFIHKTLEKVFRFLPLDI